MFTKRVGVIYNLDAAVNPVAPLHTGKSQKAPKHAIIPRVFLFLGISSHVMAGSWRGLFSFCVPRVNSADLATSKFHTLLAALTQTQKEIPAMEGTSTPASFALYDAKVLVDQLHSILLICADIRVLDDVDSGDFYNLLVVVLDQLRRVQKQLSAVEGGAV